MLESQRDISQIIVHVDMDAFYAVRYDEALLLVSLTNNE
jgi:hypothetical protein